MKIHKRGGKKGNTHRQCYTSWNTGNIFDTKALSVCLQAKSLFLQTWSPWALWELGVWLHTTGLHGTFCSLCVIHCYIYGKLKRSRIPLAQKYCIFWFNLCFNPHNASLVRLYGCNPEPIDLSGKLPTSSTRLLITACTCDANFTPKSCANQVCHQPNFSRLYITKS